jgi:DNA processing protein
MSPKPGLPVSEFRPEELLGTLSEAHAKLAPPVIYAQGDVGILASGARVAVLGPRRPTLPAIKRAVRFVEELSEDGVVLVSGMSEGIHMAVHGSALDSGARSIAVLVTGHDQVFPKTSEYLQRTLAVRNLVLSTVPRERMAQKSHFAQRDQLIALLADAVVVVEALPDSGTLATAREALRFGRPLFLMASILDDTRMTWPAELLGRGAQVLAEASQVLDILPSRGAPLVDESDSDSGAPTA